MNTISFFKTYANEDNNKRPIYASQENMKDKINSVSHFFFFFFFINLFTQLVDLQQKEAMLGNPKDF